MSSSSGGAPLRLEVDRRQPLLLRQVAGAEQRPRHGRGIEAVAVLLRRVERRVRIVDVHARQPGGIGGALFAGDELDGALGGPGGLVQRRRHAGRVPDQLAEHGAVLPYPVGVVVAHRPVVARSVAVAPVAVAVGGARLDAPVGAGQVQLADQPAVIAGVGEQPRHQREAAHERVVAVARVVAGARIGAGQKAGAARRADRTLAVGVGERGTRAPQLVQARRAHVAVALRAERVVALLVGAQPQDVGPLRPPRCTAHAPGAVSRRPIFSSTRCALVTPS